MEGHTTCAEWGRTKGHVLRWSLTGDDPHISIYETEKLVGSWDESQEIKKLSLNPGLLQVKAQMPEDPLSDGALEVFIFETGPCGRTRVFVWDARANLVTTEIHVPLLPPMGIANNEQHRALDPDITY